MKIRNPFLAVAALALGGNALAQEPAVPAPKEGMQTHLLAPSDKVLGLDLKNMADEEIGEIHDLLIDTRSGEIRYAIVQYGGFLGLGEDQRIVPWSLIEVFRPAADSDELRARTELTEAKLKAAPLCKKDDVFTSDLDRRIEAIFGKDEAWTAPDRGPRDGDVTREGETTGKAQVAFIRLKDMDGVTIKDPAGSEVGEVKELILAPQNNCIAYAVVDTKRDAGGKTVALPFSRLMFTHDRENKIVATTPVEIVRFTSAPEYDSKSWKRMSSTAWVNEMSQYYGTEPFWKTSRFASARKRPSTGGQ